MSGFIAKKHDETDCDNDRKECFENRKVNGPFNSEVVKCCGFCAIHQCFTVNVRKHETYKMRKYTIYESEPFMPCDLGVGNSNEEVFPLGTILARNFSGVSIEFTVFGKGDDKKSIKVKPGSEVVITANAISSVEVDLPCDEVKMLFTFDIFFPGDSVFSGETS